MQNLQNSSSYENNDDLWMGNHACVYEENQKAGDLPPEFLRHWKINSLSYPC